MPSSILDWEELQHDIAIIRILLNAQLKTILRHEHLLVSGVKHALQTRIISHLQDLHSAQDPARLARLRKLIRESCRDNNATVPGGGGRVSSYATAAAAAARANAAATPSQSPPYQQRTAQQQQQTGSTYAYHPQSYSPSGPASSSSSFAHGRLSFKHSPFYTIIEPLTPVAECKVRETTRDTVELKVHFSPITATRLINDPNIRVMVYCAIDNGLTQFTKSDITFPQQVDLKVNFDSVPAKLRGLKNKPGTTNPADVTPFVRKKAGYPNKIDLVYALTTKKHYVVVNLVQKHSVDELVDQLRSRKLISVEQVLREMRSRAEDSEIVATSSVMSLKCPISACRIANPCRSTVCTHNQCFDAASFLLLQEQAPTWTCPVCNKTTTFESLQIDQYVDNILKNTDYDTEQVIIEPNGEWSVHGQDGPAAAAASFGAARPLTPPTRSSHKRRSTTADDDDPDIVDITEVERPTKLLKKEDSSEMTPATFSHIPRQSQSQSQQSQPISTSHTPSRSSAKKRGHSEVIDLTLDSDDDDDDDDDTAAALSTSSTKPTAAATEDNDDEEEEEGDPIRPPKRIHTYHPPHEPPPTTLTYRPSSHSHLPPPAPTPDGAAAAASGGYVVPLPNQNRRPPLIPSPSPPPQPQPQPAAGRYMSNVYQNGL